MILIVLDTVRAESLSLYGYHRDTTPNLKRVAARGIRFDRAWRPLPGRPHRTQACSQDAGVTSSRWAGTGRSTARARRWPSILEHQGYATAGFVANTTYCSYETGLDRGFAHYEDYDVTLHAVLLCSHWCNAR